MIVYDYLLRSMRMNLCLDDLMIPGSLDLAIGDRQGRDEGMYV
jgi:hypothetical protein